VSLYEAGAYPCLIDVGEWQSMPRSMVEGRKYNSRKTVTWRVKTTCKRCFIDYIGQCRENEQTVKQGSWSFCTCPKCLPMCDEDDNPLSVKDIKYRASCPDWVPRHRPGYVKKPKKPSPRVPFRDWPESRKQHKREVRQRLQATKKKKGKTCSAEEKEEEE